MDTWYILVGGLFLAVVVFKNSGKIKNIPSFRTKEKYIIKYYIDGSLYRQREPRSFNLREEIIKNTPEENCHGTAQATKAGIWWDFEIKDGELVSLREASRTNPKFE